MNRFWITIVGIAGAILSFLLRRGAPKTKTINVDKGARKSLTAPRTLKLERREPIEWTVNYVEENAEPDRIRIQFKQLNGRPSPLSPAAPVGERTIEAKVRDGAERGRYPYDVVLVTSTGTTHILEDPELEII